MTLVKINYRLSRLIMIGQLSISFFSPFYIHTTKERQLVLKQCDKFPLFTFMDDLVIWRGKVPPPDHMDSHSMRKDLELAKREIKIIHEDITDGRDKDFHSSEEPHAVRKRNRFYGFWVLSYQYG